MWKKIACVNDEPFSVKGWEESWGNYAKKNDGLHCLSNGSLSFYSKFSGYSGFKVDFEITVPPGQGLTAIVTDYMFSIGMPGNPAAIARLRTWPVAVTGITNWQSGKKQRVIIKRKDGRLVLSVDGKPVIEEDDPLPENEIFDFHLLVPEGALLHRLEIESPDEPRSLKLERKKQYKLYSCFDFNDDVIKAPWSPKTFASAMQRYKELKVKRIYWIHHYGYKSGFWDAPGKQNEKFRENARETYESCGEFLDAVVRAAHRVEIELHAVFKPFESAIFTKFFPEGTAEALESGKIERLGGPLYNAPSFVAQNPYLRIERDISDVPQDIAERVIDSISICSEKGQKHGFDPGRINLWVSRNNGEYRLLKKPFKYNVEEINGCSRIVLRDLKIKEKYLALTVSGNPTYKFGNKLRNLLEVRDTEGAVLPITFSSPRKKNNYRVEEMVADVPESSSGNGGTLDNYMWLDGLWPVGIMKGRERYLQGALCPDYPETHFWWRREVEKMLSAGVDGIDFRIANHNLTFDWEAFGFNKPTVDLYRSRYGMNILRESFDREKWRRLRGESYTEFLRWASERLRKDGKSIQHHISRRMRSPRWHTEIEIYFDWPGWLQDGLFDEITVKMGDLKGDQAIVVSELNKFGVKANFSPYLNGCPAIPLGGISVPIARRMVSSVLDAGIHGVTMYENAAFMEVQKDGGVEITHPWLMEEFKRYAAD